MTAELPACALQNLVWASQMRWHGGLLCSCLFPPRCDGRVACCGGQAACLCPESGAGLSGALTGRLDQAGNRLPQHRGVVQQES